MVFEVGHDDEHEHVHVGRGAMTRGAWWAAVAAVLVVGSGCDDDGTEPPAPLDEYFELHAQEPAILCTCIWETSFDSVEECLEGFRRWGLSRFQLLFDLEVRWYAEERDGQPCVREVYRRHQAELDAILACGVPHIEAYLDCLRPAGCDPDTLDQCESDLFAADALPFCYTLSTDFIGTVGGELETIEECRD